MVTFCIWCTLSINAIRVSELYLPYIIMVSSKWYTLLWFIFVLEVRAFIAFCRALCLLWCRKLEMPSNAKPITLVATVPKIVVKNLVFLLLKLVNITLFHFVIGYKLSGCNHLFVAYKILHKGWFFCNV